MGKDSLFFKQIEWLKDTGDSFGTLFIQYWVAIVAVVAVCLILYALCKVYSSELKKLGVRGRSYIVIVVVVIALIFAFSFGWLGDFDFDEKDDGTSFFSGLFETFNLFETWLGFVSYCIWFGIVISFTIFSACRTWNSKFIGEFLNEIPGQKALPVPEKPHVTSFISSLGLGVTLCLMPIMPSLMILPFIVFWIIGGMIKVPAKQAAAAVMFDAYIKRERKLELNFFWWHPTIPWPELIFGSSRFVKEGRVEQDDDLLIFGDGFNWSIIPFAFVYYGLVFYRRETLERRQFTTSKVPVKSRSSSDNVDDDSDVTVVLRFAECDVTFSINVDLNQYASIPLNRLSPEDQGDIPGVILSLAAIFCRTHLINMFLEDAYTWRPRLLANPSVSLRTIKSLGFEKVQRVKQGVPVKEKNFSGNSENWKKHWEEKIWPAIWEERVYWHCSLVVLHETMKRQTGAGLEAFFVSDVTPTKAIRDAMEEFSVAETKKRTTIITRGAVGQGEIAKIVEFAKGQYRIPEGKEPSMKEMANALIAWNNMQYAEGSTLSIAPSGSPTDVHKVIDLSGR